MSRPRPPDGIPPRRMASGARPNVRERDREAAERVPGTSGSDGSHHGGLSMETDLTDEELHMLAELVRNLDSDGKGQLMIKELAGVTVGGVTMDDRVFKKIDKDRSGFVTAEELVGYCYPKIPKRRIANFFATEIPTDVFLTLKGAFHELAGRHRLTEPTLVQNGEQICGYKFTADMFRKHNKPGLTFPEVLKTLYPSLSPDMVERAMANRISVEDFLAIKVGFDTLDKEGKGFLTPKDFNRNTSKDGDSRGDWVRQSYNRTLGGMKFDMQMFNRIDKDKTGQITFPQMLRVWYPSLSERILKVYMEYYTPERLLEYREQRALVEGEEARRRERFVLAEDQRRQKIMQLFQQTQPGAEENLQQSLRTPPSTAGGSGMSSDPEESVLVTERMRQQLEKDAKERAALARMEDGSRWQVVVEENRERLRWSETELTREQALREVLYMRSCYEDDQQRMQQEAAMKKAKMTKKRDMKRMGREAPA